MRPIPKAKHIPSILILVCISLVAGAMSWQDDLLSESQISAATALQARNPEIYGSDALLGRHFADGKLREAYSPAFLMILRLSTPPGCTNPILPFHILVGPLTLLFLLGMYALLWRQTLSSATSTFVALLSMAIIKTLGENEWGIGSLNSATPDGILIALSPMLMLCYLRYFHRSKLPLVFLLVGIIGNVAMAGAFNLAVILLLTYLVCHKFNRYCLLIGLCCAFMFVVGILPELSHSLMVRLNVSKSIAVFSYPDSQAITEACRLARMKVMYPALLKPIAQWIGYPAVMAFVSIIVLWRLNQFRTRDVDVWVWMVIWGVVVAIGFHGIALATVFYTDEPIPFFNFLQAAVWVMLPLYVLTARALTQIFRILDKRHRHLLRWILAGVMVGWLLPSDAMRPIRRGIYRLAAMTSPGRESLYIQDGIERVNSQQELIAIALWVRDNTPQASMFINNKAIFRLYSQRSVLPCSEDLPTIYYYAPEKISDWNYSYRKAGELLCEPLLPSKIVTSVNALAGKQQYAGVQSWYLVTNSRTLPEKPGGMEEIQSDRWGQYWRLVKIPTAPTTKTLPG